MRRILGLAALLFLLTGLCMGQALPSSTQPVFQLDTLHQEVSLAHYTWALPDAGDDHSLEALRSGAGDSLFAPLSKWKGGIFLATEKPWGRLRIHNALNRPLHRALTFNYMADSIRVFMFDEQGKVEEFRLGKLIRGSQIWKGDSLLNEPYDSKMPVFFELKPGETRDFYFRVFNTSSNEVWIKPILRSFRSLYYHQSEQRSRYAKAFFFQGLLWMFLLYNLLYFLFSREKSYLYLALYILCFSLPNDLSSVIFLTQSGFPEFPFLVQLRLVILNPGVYISLSYFMRAYLNSKTDFPRTHRYLVVITWIGWVFLLVSIVNYALTGSGFIMGSVVPANLVSLVATALFVLIFLDLRKHRKTHVWFWLAAMTWLLFFHLLTALPAALGLDELTERIYNVFHPFASTGIGVLGQILIFTLGLGYRSREVAEEKEVLEQRDALKSRFFANISHEFRTPLTLVMGPLKQLLEETEDPKTQNLLRLAHQNASRQLGLINDLLDLSKLEAGKMTLQVRKEDVIPQLRGIVYAYDSLAEQKEVELCLAFQDQHLELYWDREKVETILYNLLSNAFRFTPAGGSITVAQEILGNELKLSVTDTGPGIAAERLPGIFDRFFQAGNHGGASQEGTGIGLSLVRELVQLHHGRVEVESEEGVGSTFSLYLPLGSKHYSREEMASELAEPEASPAIILPQAYPDIAESESSGEKATILVIEDNADMRFFIHQRLSSAFHVITAEDGEAGLTAALDTMPELIISDVMMPKKNGYEVCKALKSDVRTSHIPVILLTAKAAMEEKLEGLETGADDYLVKPFESRELLTRVQNLIQLRKRLRARFAESVLLQPSEVTTNPVDTRFLEQALALVEENLGKQDFGVEALAREIGMSRASLNRKFRALCNQSTNRFIQTVRLQRAADLLAQQTGSVAEVAHQVGFSSTAYFVKCFKDHFGVTPGNYEPKN